MFLDFFGSSGFAASLYYFLFSRKFDREHKAVIKGELNFRRKWLESSGGREVLRRNIHRIEKGLIMKPRRDVFGKDYIVETVKCYANLIEVSGFTEENRWAGDVLGEYFSVVSASDLVIEQARAIYSAVEKVEDSSKLVPYLSEHRPALTVDFESLNNLFKRRRSVRWFENEEIPREILNKAIDSASYAPSACNRQPFRFVVSGSSSVASELAGMAMGSGGFRDNIPCLVAVVGQLNAYPDERDRHVIYIDGALCGMQLLLALEALGLSSCVLNWPDIEERERKISSRLDLESFERVIMLIAVGYPRKDGGIPYSQKKQSDELLSVVS